MAWVVAFWKPRHMTVEQGSAPTHGRDGRRRTINDEIERFRAEFGREGDAEVSAARLSAVGRLDKDTTGLLLFTDDGALNERVLWPGTCCPKVYEATVKMRRPARPSAEQLEQLVSGVQLVDGFARCATAELVSETEQAAADPAAMSAGRRRALQQGRKRARTDGGGDDDGGDGGAGDDAAPPPPTPPPFGVYVIRVTLTMGRNRVVRRLLAHVGLPVSALARVAIGPLTLEGLGRREPGDACRLSGEHEAALRAAVAPRRGSPQEGDREAEERPEKHASACS